MTDNHSNAEKPHEEVMAPRFHQAHSVGNRRPTEAPAPPPELLLAVAGKNELASEQLQQQAAELAEHLQHRHRDLARREASLNARSAEYDDQQRSARLWLRERQNELHNRETEFQRQRKKLEEQAAADQLASQTIELLAREQEQAQRTEQSLEEPAKQLRAMLQNVQQQAAWLEAARNSWRQQCQDEQRTLNQLREQLLDQREATEELNARLREQLAENQREALQEDQLTQQRRQLEIETAQLQERQAALADQELTLGRDRELWQARTAQQRQAIATTWHRRRQELQRQRESLQTHRQTINDQEDALYRQREELERQKREIVQQQLVVRQAHATLSRQIPARDFSQIEQGVRQFVESQLAAAEQMIVKRKRELQDLAASLQQQQETLKIRHARLHAQITLRQQELDTQAARLGCG